jgi:hypothetical protein
MPRSKPYTKKLAILDIVLLLTSVGAWGAVIIVRELYRRL